MDQVWANLHKDSRKHVPGHHEHSNKHEVPTAVLEFPSEMAASCWVFVSLNMGKMMHLSTKELARFNLAETL